MKPYVLYSPSAKELNAISAMVNFLMKKRGAVSIPECIQKLDRMKLCLEEPEHLRMLVCDVTTEGIIPLLEQIREKNTEMKLVLVADNSVSPVSYIRPSILPTALLWRPLQADSTRDTLWDVMQTIPAETENAAAAADAFAVEVRGCLRQIPYQEILFFEASNKRLNLHTRRKVITFPGTLEKLMEQLPQDFIRVHKSFIVNRKAILQIQFGQNLIMLEEGLTVPVSRSYKSELKAVFT